MSDETKKVGAFEKLAAAAGSALSTIGSSVDLAVEKAAEFCGSLLPAVERVAAEEALEDVVDGFKADDSASAGVVAPVATAATPEAPAATQ